jgi:predicted AAA+ superfamily ATPase
MLFRQRSIYSRLFDSCSLSDRFGELIIPFSQADRRHLIPVLTQLVTCWRLGWQYGKAFELRLNRFRRCARFGRF